MPSPLVEFSRAWLSYHSMTLRLVARAGLERDFARVMAITGQMRRSEVRCIYELAREAPAAGVIVEIGSHRGLSTVALARGSRRGAGSTVYAIDPHEYLDPGAGKRREGWRYDSADARHFYQNLLLAGVAENVRPLAMLSWDAAKAWDKPVSLLWIDGDHEYPAVKRDFADWAPFVLSGGHIAFHDSAHPDDGPYRVVREAVDGGKFEFVRQVEKVSVLRKR